MPLISEEQRKQTELAMASAKPPKSAYLIEGLIALTLAIVVYTFMIKKK